MIDIVIPVVEDIDYRPPSGRSRRRRVRARRATARPRPPPAPRAPSPARKAYASFLPVINCYNYSIYSAIYVKDMSVVFTIMLNNPKIICNENNEPSS